MAVSDMNVRIGLDLRELRKGTKEMEKMLQQTSSNISGIADKMMMSISAPLIGIGVAAVSASSEFEALRLAMNTTMTDAGYSVKQTSKELEELRKIALAPGIDLEQAVKGSIRLQNVGISAEKARETLKQLSNAIASAGGGAQQLDSVTIQLAQMHAKGVVMASDLRVIQDSMPGITKAMQQAFGQSTAEGIRSAGINAEQFIEGVTAQLAQNARVQGGVKNAIDNARSAMTQFLAGIGDTINETYNLNQVAEDLSAKLGYAASAFKNLDPETKKAILNFALYALAAGPVLKVFSSILSGAQSAILGIRLIGTGFTNLGIGIINLYDKFSKLSLAMKFTTIGAAIAVVGALYLAFQGLNKGVSDAMHVTNALNKVEEKAIGYYAEQKGKLDLLYTSVNNTNLSEKQRQGSLEDLQKLYPKYFANLTLEDLKTGKLKTGYDSLTESLIKSARVRAGEEQLNDITKDQLTLEQKRIKLIDYYNASLSKNAEAAALNNAVTQTGRDESAKAFAEKRKDFAVELAQVDKGLKSRQSEVDAITSVIQANTEESQSQKDAIEAKRLAAIEAEKLAKANEKNGSSISDTKKQLDVYYEALSDVENVMNYIKATGQTEDVFEDQVKAIDSSIKKLLDAGYSPDNPKVKKFLDMMKALRGKEIEMAPTIATPQLPVADEATRAPAIPFGGAEIGTDALETIAKATEGVKIMNLAAVETKITIDGLSASFAGMLDSMGMSVQGMAAVGEGMKAMAAVSGEAFGGLIESALGVSGAYTRMGAAALVAASKMVKAALAATIAKAIQGSMEKSGHPLLGIALAGIATAGVMALFGRLEQSVSKSPKFAKGAMVYGPTSAIVGDNPGASVDPEVIAPLSKLKEYMGDGTGSANVSGEFRIRGADLVLAIEKNNQINNRIKGR